MSVKALRLGKRLLTKALLLKAQLLEPKANKALAIEIATKQYDKTEKSIADALEPFFKEQIESAVGQLKKIGGTKAFCPTGPGGGVDNSCSPHGGHGKTEGYARLSGKLECDQWIESHHIKYNEKEQEAVREWKGWTNEGINGILRGKPVDWMSDSIRDKLLGRIETLDKAAEKGSLPDNMVLTRYVSEEFAYRMKVGKVFQDNGFVATSLDTSFEAKSLEADLSDQTEHLHRFHILAPKGTHGFCADQPELFENSLNEVEGESEWVLPRNSTFEVVGHHTLKYLGVKEREQAFVKGTVADLEVDMVGQTKGIDHRFETDSGDRFVWHPVDVVFLKGTDLTAETEFVDLKGTEVGSGTANIIPQVFNPKDWTDKLIQTALPPIAQAMVEGATAQWLMDQRRLKRKKAFCPTGPGGGIDNSCGRGAGAGKSEMIQVVLRLRAAGLGDVPLDVYKNPTKQEVRSIVNNSKFVKGLLKNGDVYLWDADTGTEANEFTHHDNVAGALGFRGYVDASEKFYLSKKDGQIVVNAYDTWVNDDGTSQFSESSSPLVSWAARNNFDIKSKHFYRTKASSASRWLEGLTEQDLEDLGLIDTIFETEYGDVHLKVSTEFPPELKEAIEEHLNETFNQPYWESINETTGGDIDDYLTNGIEERKSIEEMASEMADEFGEEYPKTRGRNIGRTESGNALNGGRTASIEALKEELGDDYPMKRVWLALLDNRTRDEHADLDGVPEDENGTWDMAGFILRWPSDVNLPPELRCNCRCTIVNEIGMQDDEAEELLAAYKLRQIRREQEDDPENETDPADAKAFCATGVGGGIDNSCSPGGGDYEKEGVPDLRQRSTASLKKDQIRYAQLFKERPDFDWGKEELDKVNKELKFRQDWQDRQTTHPNEWADVSGLLQTDSEKIKDDWNSYEVQVGDKTYHVGRGVGYAPLTMDGPFVMIDGLVVEGPRSQLMKPVGEIPEVYNAIQDHYKAALGKDGGDFSKVSDDLTNNNLGRLIAGYKSPLTATTYAPVLQSITDAYVAGGKVASLSVDDPIQRNIDHLKKEFGENYEAEIRKRFPSMAEDELSLTGRAKRMLQITDEQKWKGGLISQGTVNAFAKAVEQTQAELRTRYPNGSLELYRGVQGDYAKEIKKELKSKDAIDVPVSSASSFSQSKSIASTFAGRSGVVMKQEVPIDRVLFSWETTQQLSARDYLFGGTEEQEVLVASPDHKIHLTKGDIVK